MDKLFIIAEAGVNHNGDITLAYQLIDQAVKSGVDAIKFQTFKHKKLAIKNAGLAKYQEFAIGSKESQQKMLKSLELSEAEFLNIKQYCTKKGILFLSSPFDIESIDFLHNIGLNIYKIPSGEITNAPYLRKIGGLNKEILMSTGMADLGEIRDAMNILISSGTQRNNITIMHCNTSYPTPIGEANLRAILTIKKEFDVRTGYSDHTLDFEAGIAAVALGASVIEKHFTLNRDSVGPDHLKSLESFHPQIYE